MPRIFSPVILYHDDPKSNINNLYTHIHDSAIRLHRKHVNSMFKTNGALWAAIIREAKASPSSFSRQPSPRKTPEPELFLAHPSLSSSPSSEASTSSLSMEPEPPLALSLLLTPTHTPQPPRISRSRRANLPKTSINILRVWLENHEKNPYPTDEEKHILAWRTNLTFMQVSNWFVNARRRILRPRLKNRSSKYQRSLRLQTNEIKKWTSRTSNDKLNTITTTYKNNTSFIQVRVY
ncbi:uncharacterized protein VTP21DRAFT_10551 [Calcarisporiella thermophila]|uniref:uncharacterized protein n=1 Tax=Calcarisporiella thermophila TaxID=911321 RepID=UPI00374237E6